jgi:hypothetical protein
MRPGRTVLFVLAGLASGLLACAGNQEQRAVAEACDQYEDAANQESSPDPDPDLELALRLEVPKAEAVRRISEQCGDVRSAVISASQVARACELVEVIGDPSKRHTEKLDALRSAEGIAGRLDAAGRAQFEAECGPRAEELFALRDELQAAVAASIVRRRPDQSSTPRNEPKNDSLESDQRRQEIAQAFALEWNRTPPAQQDAWCAARQDPQQLAEMLRRGADSAAGQGDATRSEMTAAVQAILAREC